MTLCRVPFFILFIGVFSCNNASDDQQSGTTKYVKIEQVKGGQQVERLLFNGRIKEKSLTSLSFRVGGPLVSFTLKEGDRVRTGEMIAAIDDRDYLLNLQSAKAQYEQLKGEYKRYKELLLRKKVPENSFEKVESGYLTAETAFENTKNQLKDTKLRSPITGYIHEKFAENFQTVSAGQPIVSIIDLSVLEVLINVSESQLLKIKEAKESYVTVKNANVTRVPVKISSIGEKAKEDGLFEVKYVLQNDRGWEIYPGMSAEVMVHIKNESHLVNISSGAVFHENDRDYVWVYDTLAKSIRKREVEVKKIATGGRVEVVRGIEPGEMIVSAGVYYLFEEQRVIPIDQPSKTNVGGLL